MKPLFTLPPMFDGRRIIRGMSARTLLARFAFPLLIIGIALTFTGRTAARAGNTRKATLAHAGSVLCVVAGFVGVRLRHRPGGPGMTPASDKLRDPESADPRPPVS